MPVQHANRKIKRKRNIDFIEVIKGGVYIQMGLGFSLYSLTKEQGKRTGKQKNRLSYRQ